MAPDAFPDQPYPTQDSALHPSSRVLPHAQNHDVLATIASAIVELWRARLASFTATAQIDQFKSKTLFARLWQEAGGPLDASQIEDLQAMADKRAAELLEARLKRQPPTQSYFPIRPKSDQSRQQAASGRRDPERWARKQRLGGLAALPPTDLHAGFTEGERAVLYIIAADMRETGGCKCTVAEIAARAGIGQTTVRNAIRKARDREILKVEHRPQWRNKWLANVITIICKTWLGWLKRFRPNLGSGFKGVKKPASTDTYGSNNKGGRPSEQPKDGPTGRLQRLAIRKPSSG
ncbi:helix-turn-helix transcriptional regulator [Rhizobium aegyptiacum]|uniref:helix-turn-helix transcriptional regulator n=1 Tax=Rhizobium aegyptiacum TaxID=1764550 RepID=UPI000AC70F39|nr:hypothetical protein [Rhizobium aegyptiacum]